MSNAFQKKSFPFGRMIHRFLREEHGAMTPYILIFIFLMLVFGGISVDVMRFEARRVAVQNTLDRATLAVANMNQVLSLSRYGSKQAHAEAIVQDHFDKAGLGSSLEYVHLDDGINYRVVEARAKVVSNNFFMSILDVPTLNTMNASQAEQRISNVEIALVLDVSGSMYNDITRITNLKSAAKDFIDMVLKNDTENKISISIVPYNGQVNLGPDIFAMYNATHKHGYANSWCLDLPPSTYTSTSLSRFTALPQTPFADAWSSTTTSGNWVALQRPAPDSVRSHLYANVWCNPVEANYVRLHSNNIPVLKSQIEGLVAIGATSIDVGMKWGTAFLDPEAQPVVASLASRGLVPTHFSNRPAPYNTPETIDKTMKVVVLMTDGENFEQERFSDSYRSGPSPIWRANQNKDKDRNFSIFHESKVDKSTSTKLCNSRPFWVPHLSAWHSRPWNGTTPSSSACYSTTAVTSDTTQQTWQQVWEAARVKWVARQLYVRAVGGSVDSWTNQIRSLTSISTMDSRLNDVCTAAKAKGILVYGIAFEAPAGGQAAIKKCVTSPESDYFYVTADNEGINIATAFTFIATNLTQLRLTQ
ncbi:TadE/TadG family type IV pilus assembly protein [Pseudogemmobacter humi]|uniref:von Willebrand factor type A domain protein n=1 Tax=Pseudogemmobacter humi TaxID=2483812 RepID=A0A3P5XLH7_9RHOB|nr:pilus assembly protein TadG-related protein [Pseudogemmobacter humi]VDC28586.1 von Willebrand factor type A domain protein [Pseudogemmobacter humi]